MTTAVKSTAVAVAAKTASASATAFVKSNSSSSSSKCCHIYYSYSSASSSCHGMNTSSTWIFAGPTKRLLQKVIDPPLPPTATKAAKLAAATLNVPGLPNIIDSTTMNPDANLARQQQQQEQNNNNNSNNSSSLSNSNSNNNNNIMGVGNIVAATKSAIGSVSTHATPLPKRIILLRHGESLGNVDETSYGHIPDWKIPLTRRGERQALRAAKDLHKLLTRQQTNTQQQQPQNGDNQGSSKIINEALFTYCSPYKRTNETWEIMKKYLQEQNELILLQDDDDEEEGENNNNKSKKPNISKNFASIELIGTREEPRIAEQQFGNFQNPHKVRTAKAERRTFGRFFFRFPNGEAGLDVYNRVSSFWATVSRDLLQLQAITDLEHLNILIVTHGLTLRLLLMRYFQLSVEEFEASYNSQNAKLVVMERKISRETGKEYFQLQEEAKEALNLKGDISNNLPVYWRADALMNKPYDRED